MDKINVKGFTHGETPTGPLGSSNHFSFLQLIMFLAQLLFMYLHPLLIYKDML